MKYSEQFMKKKIRLYINEQSKLRSFKENYILTFEYEDMIGK